MIRLASRSTIKVQPAQKLHITPFVASLLMCLLACDLSADTPQIRLSVQAQGEHGDDARMVSALSHEFRKLDGVSVTDTQPALKVTCVVIPLTATRAGDKIRTGYACSVAVVGADDHLITHLVQAAATIESLAHEIAVDLDGSVIEEMRRTARPSSSP
jgi:hypothetical protein